MGDDRMAGRGRIHGTYDEERTEANLSGQAIRTGRNSRKGNSMPGYKKVADRKKSSRAEFTIVTVDHRHQTNGVKSATLRCTTPVAGVDVPFNVFVNGGNLTALIPHMYVGRTLLLEGVYSQANTFVCKKLIEDVTDGRQAA